MTKLILLKAGLIAWGQSLQVTDGGRENTALRDHWSAEGETVGRCLTSIEMMFEEADQTESRYGLKPLSAHSGSISLPQEQRSNAFSRVETVLRSRVVQRQEGVSMLQKTRWTICDKKKSDSMIADLTLLIDGLIDLSERLQALELQQRLLRVEVQAITDVGSIRLMEEASDQLQAPARSQITERGSDRRDTSGHTYINTIIKDQAKILNGNIGYQSQTSYVYRGFQVLDDAHAMQGDVSNEAALAFLNSGQ